MHDMFISQAGGEQSATVLHAPAAAAAAAAPAAISGQCSSSSSSSSTTLLHRKRKFDQTNDYASTTNLQTSYNSAGKHIHQQGSGSVYGDGVSVVQQHSKEQHQQQHPQ